MEIILSDRFKKSIRGKEDFVNKKLARLYNELNSNEVGIWGTTISKQTRKFQGVEDLFKFRISDGERIIFTYTPLVQMGNHQGRVGLVLIEYSSHDAQGLKAKRIGSGKKVEGELDNKFVFYDSIAPIHLDEIKEENESISNSFAGSSSLYLEYENYLDLNKFSAWSLKFKDNGEMCEEALINEEQWNIVQDNNPLLLIGGAGSGKTLVCVNKAAALSKKNHRIGYFTFSPRLIREAQKLLTLFHSDSIEDIKLFTLQQYFMEKLDIGEEQVVNERKFEIWFKNNSFKTTINSYNVWAEIRGLIKGYMGNGWLREKSFQVDAFDDKTKKFLEENRLIICEELVKGRVEYVFNSRESFDKVYDSQWLDAQQASDIDSAKLGAFIDEIRRPKFDRYNYLNNMLSWREYRALDEERSTYNEEEKKVIYGIAKAYQGWLKAQDLYDDNDLALRILELTYGNTFQPWDYLVVDEVQDLTELQIFMLFSMAKNLDSVMLAGDVNQTINPTYYSNERITTLRYYHLQKNTQDYIVSLKKNYRSQEEIVTLANALAELRRKYIGKADSKEEELEISMVSGHPLFSLTPSDDNLRELLEYAEIDPTVCILIPHKEYEDQLAARYPGINFADIDMYFVQDAKGIEFENVIALNIVSAYKESWKTIFRGEGRKNALFRFYFNLFYVAITRAKKNLCLYEEEEIPEIRTAIGDLFEEASHFDPEALGYTGVDQSPEKWAEQALSREQKGMFRSAKRFYTKAGREADVQRCEGLLQFEEGNYADALTTFILYDEYEVAETCFRRIRGEWQGVGEAISFIFGKKEESSDTLELSSLINPLLKLGSTMQDKEIWKKIDSALETEIVAKGLTIEAISNQMLTAI